jgi:hypothetical protein
MLLIIQNQHVLYKSSIYKPQAITKIFQTFIISCISIMLQYLKYTII